MCAITGNNNRHGRSIIAYLNQGIKAKPNISFNLFNLCVLYVSVRIWYGCQCIYVMLKQYFVLGYVYFF